MLVKVKRNECGFIMYCDAETIKGKRFIKLASWLSSTTGPGVTAHDAVAKNRPENLATGRKVIIYNYGS